MANGQGRGPAAAHRVPGRCEAALLAAAALVLAVLATTSWMGIGKSRSHGRACAGRARGGRVGGGGGVAGAGQVLVALIRVLVVA